MLTITRVILSLCTLLFAVYLFFTKNDDLIPYLTLLVGSTMLLTGVAELQKDRKNFWGYFSIIGSLFLFFVSIKVFF